MLCKEKALELRVKGDLVDVWVHARCFILYVGRRKINANADN